MELAQRLVVAADFDPRKCGGVAGVSREVTALARALEGTGVILKANSILRAAGHRLIAELRARGLQVFADLKLCDIPETMGIDAALLAQEPPAILTVMCGAGEEGMRRVKEALGERTTVLGVTVLTSLGYRELLQLGLMPCDVLDEQERAVLEKRRVERLVASYATMARSAGLDGVIASPREVTAIRAACGREFAIVTPGIRPVWAQVPGDDQKRTATPAEAIQAGAQRIVVGRPITQAAPNDKGLPESPREAVERTLAEIEAALEKKE